MENDCGIYLKKNRDILLIYKYYKMVMELIVTSHGNNHGGICGDSGK